MDSFNIGKTRVLFTLLKVAVNTVPVLVHIVEAFVFGVGEKIRASLTPSGRRSTGGIDVEVLVLRTIGHVLRSRSVALTSRSCFTGLVTASAHVSILSDTFRSCSSSLAANVLSSIWVAIGLNSPSIHVDVNANDGDELFFFLIFVAFFAFFTLFSLNVQSEIFFFVDLIDDEGAFTFNKELAIDGKNLFRSGSIKKEWLIGNIIDEEFFLLFFSSCGRSTGFSLSLGNLRVQVNTGCDGRSRHVVEFLGRRPLVSAVNGSEISTEFGLLLFRNRAVGEWVRRRSRSYLLWFGAERLLNRGLESGLLACNTSRSRLNCEACPWSSNSWATKRANARSDSQSVVAT